MGKAELKIKGQDAIIRDLERKFSGYGLPSVVKKQNVTGKHHPEVEVQATDRGVRDSTADATKLANQKEAPKSQVGVKQPGTKTKNSLIAESLLPKLYDISIKNDQEQPKAKLEFLLDQRTERKQRLPPIIGSLGVERRRKLREENQEKLRKKEKEDEEQRNRTVGMIM